MGFFDDSGYGKQKPSGSPMCGKCGLLTKCRSPKVGTFGSGKRKILIVTNGPNRDVDKHATWERITTPIARRLSVVCIDLDRDCVVSGAVVCSPNFNGVPSADMVRHCRPILLDTIKRVDPVAILCVGSAAVQGVLGHDWGEGKDTRLSVWNGECIPSQKLNAWVVPCTDPSEIDGEKDLALMGVRASMKWLAKGTLKRPWDHGVPDYESMVNVCFTESEAVDAIDSMMRDPRTEALALDYETNALKPETAGASIYSVSWSNGYDTMAAPWFPGVRAISQRVMRSKVPKIACNIAFEERWTIQEFGHGVTGWYWDNMQAAHWMNNRPGITSIKFQSYAKLGQPDYSGNITRYFKSKPGKLNNIKQVNLADLLVYNGADSLLEYMVAMDQIGESGYPCHFKNRFDELRPLRIRH